MHYCQSFQFLFNEKRNYFFRQGFWSLMLILFAQLINAQENSYFLCTDGIDNDEDGQIDCEDDECQLVNWTTCLSCNDLDISYADSIVYADLNCLFINEHITLSDIFGKEDFKYVSLGEGGEIALAFTDNILSNSGNSLIDLSIFEIGLEAEPTLISLRPSDDFTRTALLDAGFEDAEGDDFFEISRIQGSAKGVDIDEYLIGYTHKSLAFDAVKLKDLTGDCLQESPGADIDALCANTLKNYDCLGVYLGLAQIDTCGFCLDPMDINFNLHCVVNDDVFIPNAFSPNGDGVNDFFTAYSANGFLKSITLFQIFDRWGNLVHEAKTISHSNFKGWDGTFKNKALQPGLFTYNLSVKYINDTRKSFNGSLVLVK